MKSIVVELQFHSPWHVSSGKGGGPAVDATVVKTSEGLPYVPGRAVKGLLRDAVGVAEANGAIASGTMARLFGTDLDEAPVDELPARYATSPGSLRFRSATLPETWREAALTEPGWAAEFFDVVAATALEDGVALAGSLRTKEVVVPMRLTCEIEGPGDDDWVAPLREAMPLVRAAGAGRHRGYGRLTMQIAEAGR